MVFDSLPPALIPVFLVAGFGVIVVAIIIIKKKTKIFSNDEGPKSDKEIAQEELDRILEPIEEEKPSEEKAEESEEKAEETENQGEDGKAE